MSGFANQFIAGLINPIYSDDLGALGTAIGRVPGVYQDKKKEAERLDRAKFMEIITQQGLASAAQGDTGALSGRMNDLTAMIENATTDEEINKITAKISQLNQLSEKTADVGLTNTAESILKTKEALKNENLPPEVKAALEDRLATMQGNPEALIRAEEIVSQRQSQLVNALAQQKAAKAVEVANEGRGLKYGSREYNDWVNKNRKDNPNAVREVENWNIEFQQKVEKLRELSDKNKSLSPEDLERLKNAGVTISSDPQINKASLKALIGAEIEILKQRALNPTSIIKDETVATYVTASLGRIAEEYDAPLNLFDDVYNVIEDLSKEERAELEVLVLDKKVKPEELDSFVLSFIKDKYPEAFGRSQSYVDERAANERDRMEYEATRMSVITEALAAKGYSKDDDDYEAKLIEAGMEYDKAFREEQMRLRLGELEATTSVGSPKFRGR